MNERTLELYKLAHVPHTDIDPSNNMPYETTIFSAEKFAELIIRECAKIADERQFKHRNNYPISIAIEEHFGLDYV